MKICESMRKFPGGMMVIPMLLGCLVNTFIPNAFEIGGFTTAVFKTGSSTLIGVFLFCSGVTIRFKEAGVSLLKGIALTGIKFAFGCFVGYGLNFMFGSAGIFGITPLAVIAGMTNSNGGLYTALSKEFGDATDTGAFAVLSLNIGPVFTMIALGMAGMANIPISSMIAAVIPLIIGMILGNLDEDFCKLFEPGMDVLIPFTGFTLGANMDFRSILSAGIQGLLLGIGTIIITGFFTFLVYSLIRKKWDPMGMAVGTVGANAVATPASVALADKTFEPYVASATAQIAAASVFTAIVTPILTGMFYKFANEKNSKKQNKSEEEKMRK